MAEYIEREAAIDALTEQNLVVHIDSVNDGLVASCHRSAQRVIANIPASDVRPVVRGKWIRENNPSYSPFDDSSEYIYRCNQCGESNARDSAFCPNCGADMRNAED